MLQYININALQYSLFNIELMYISILGGIKMSLEIEINLDENQNNWIIVPKGEIDIYTSPKFKQKVLDAFDKEDKDLLIDCSDLDYMDSTGLGSLIYILKKVKEKDHKIYIENVKPNIKKIFDITKLDKLFIIRGEISE